MQKLRNIRTTNLKNAMLNKRLTRTKSANWKEKPNQGQKSTRNSINNINNNNNLNNKDVNNFDIFDLDFNFKNETELADKIYKANQLKIKESEIEDEEINTLNEEIRKIMLKNYEIQKNIQSQLNLRYIYEKNQKSIASYINDLNYKFRNYDETIKQHDFNINKMKRENKKLQNDYDKKIEEIEKENEKLKKRIRDRIELYLHQKGQIEEKSSKTQNLEKEINMQNSTIKQRIDMNKKKVDKLENKYDEMYKKLINMEVNCEDKKIKNMIINNLYTIDENDKKNKKVNKKSNEKKNIQQKIEDCELNNDALLFELNELNKQYEELTKNNDLSKEKKPSFSFNNTTMKSTSNFTKETQHENKFK